MQLAEPVVALFDYPIADIVAALPDAGSPVWDLATFRQNNFAPHAVTRSIVFRWPAPGWKPGSAPVVLRATVLPADLTAAIDACADRIATEVGGEAVRVTLAELPPGGRIEAHHDIGNLTLIHRCHLPIVTSDDAVLTVERKPHRLRAGTVYDFDNTRLHSAANRGPAPRVHLLCDVLPFELMR